MAARATELGSKMVAVSSSFVLVPNRSLSAPTPDTLSIASHSDDELFTPLERRLALHLSPRELPEPAGKVEHNLAKVGVVGSNPIARSNNFNDLVGNWCSLHRAKLAHS